MLRKNYKRQTTSNDIIAGDGREWFMIEYKFKKKCVFCVFKGTA